jgi:hypothetical protein
MMGGTTMICTVLTSDDCKQISNSELPRHYDAGIDCKRIIREEWGIELPKTYLLGFEHNNCIPCWKSGSKDYWKLVWKHYPERYQMAIEMEEYTGHTHFKGISLTELARKWSEPGREG